MRRYDKPYQPPIPTSCDECGKDIYISRPAYERLVKRNEKKLCHECQLELDVR